MNISECAICFEVKPLGTLKPCNHELCPRCIHTLLLKSVQCPFCRNVFNDCVPPLVVFDESLYSNIKSVMMERNKKTKKFGIGIKQNHNCVIVSSVEKYTRKKGILENQTIIAVNNIPCYDKQCLIDILMNSENNRIYFGSI